MTVKAYSLFSPLGESAVIGGILPQVGTLIDGAFEARPLVGRVGAQVGVLAVVGSAPAAVRGRVEAAAGAGRAPFHLVPARRMVSQIVIIVGGDAGAAQVRVRQSRARAA